MKVQSSKRRFIQAYLATAKILGRYFWLGLSLKILPKSRAQEKTLKAHQKTALEIRQLISQLKGLFIKVGQMLSIMTQFLPEAITQELQALQDATEPSDFKDIKQSIEEELGKSLAELFSSFEETPIASASLGQVHRARSRQGQDLAIKVRHPGIEKLVKSDLRILSRLFGLLHWIFPNYGIKRSFEEIREVVLSELNFANEMEHLKIFENNFKDNPQVTFPKTHPELSSNKVLALEYVEGLKIRDLDGMKKLKIEPKEVARLLVEIYCQQIFVDGFYHADPHPGNFLVQATQPEPSEQLKKTKPVKNFRLVMLDFGAVSQVSPAMRQGMARFMEGVLKRDTELLSNSMKEMGFIAQDKDEEVFDKIVEFFYERLKDIKIEDVQSFRLENISKIEHFIELKKLDLSFTDLLHSFNVPRDWALLERSLLLLMGLTQHLAPQYNPLETILPYAQNFLLGGEKLGDFLVKTLKEALLSYVKLPAELQKTLKSLKKGELKIGHPEAIKEQKRLRRTLSQFTYALVAFGLWHVSEQSTHLVQLKTPLLYLSGGFAFLFLLNFFRKGSP